MTKAVPFVFASCLFFLSSICYGQNFWEQVSGPEGADRGNNIIGIATGANGSVFVVGSDSTILYTPDGNAPWRNYTPPGGNNNLGAFTAVGASRNGIIFVGAQGIVPPYVGVKSTDNGATWSTAYQPLTGDGSQVASITVSPSGMAYETAWGGWRGPQLAVEYGGSVSITGDLFDSPNHPGALTDMVVGSSGLLYLGTDNGVYVSTNNGTHWRLCSPPHSITQLARAPNGHIFATSGSDDIILRSTDNGASWNSARGNLPQFRNYERIAIDSNGFLYCGGRTGIYRSTDDGNSWIQSTAGLADSEEYPYLAVNSEGKIFAASTRHGMFRSTDQGQTWQRWNPGFTNHQASSLTFDSVGNLYAGTNVGIFKSTDLGENWLFNDMQGYSIAALTTTTTGAILASAERHTGGNEPPISLFRSSDAGAQWVTVSSSITDFSQPLVASASAGGTCYGLSSSGFFASTDDGIHWKKQADISRYAGQMAISPNGSLFSINYDVIDSVYRSVDGGKTWSSFFAGNLRLQDVAVSPLGDVYISSFGPHPWTSIYRSTDKGMTWTDQNDNAAPTMQGALQKLTFNQLGIAFAVTDSGVYRSYDNCATWHPVMSGLTAHNFGDLIVSKDGTLFLSTEQGIYRSAHSSLGVSKYENVADIGASIFPNPVTRSATISFVLPISSYISLKLFDATGREISTLANGYFDAGEHEIKFDRGNLPSRVYFYRLEANGESQTRAMVIEP